MNTKTIAAAVALLALGGALGWGASHWHAGTDTAQPAAASERKVLYWYDPMVPGQKFDKPGKSPSSARPASARPPPSPSSPPPTSSVTASTCSIEAR